VEKILKTVKKRDLNKKTFITSMFVTLLMEGEGEWWKQVLLLYE